MLSPPQIEFRQTLQMPHILHSANIIPRQIQNPKLIQRIQVLHFIDVVAVQIEHVKLVQFIQMRDFIYPIFTCSKKRRVRIQQEGRGGLKKRLQPT